MSNKTVVINKKYEISTENFINKDDKFKEFREQALNELIGAKKALDDKDSSEGEKYKNKDYGIMKGRKCLFHRGAEKLRQKANFVPNWKHEIISNSGKFALISKCYLYHQDKVVAVGAGGGVGIDDFSWNKAVQMADIRSFKKAIRIAYNIIDEYTQDIEEKVIEKINQKKSEIITEKKELTLQEQFNKLDKDKKIEIVKWVAGILTIEKELTFSKDDNPMHYINLLSAENKELLLRKVKMGNKKWEVPNQ